MKTDIENKLWNGEPAKLLECPFCGGKPVLTHIGNDFTKKRSVEIKCSRCRVRMLDSAIKHSLSWLEGVTIPAWNNRS